MAAVIGCNALAAYGEQLLPNIGGITCTMSRMLMVPSSFGSLRCPAGSLEIDAFSLGKVVWRAAEGCIEIWSSQPLGTARLVAPKAMRILMNGADVTQQLRHGKGEARVYEPRSAG